MFIIITSLKYIFTRIKLNQSHLLLYFISTLASANPQRFWSGLMTSTKCTLSSQWKLKHEVYI